MKEKFFAAELSSFAHSVSEKEKELQITNGSLKLQLEELRDRLDRMTNTQAKERVVIDKALAEKSQKIDELIARNAELEKEIKEKGSITTQIDNNKGKVSFLEEHVIAFCFWFTVTN